jgi:O-antigen ligase
MSGAPQSVAVFFGFPADQPADRPLFPAALALAGTLAALPLLLHLPVDTDRALPLAFLPTLILLRKNFCPANRLIVGLLLWAASVMLLSALLADHPARSLVMTAAVACTLAGGVAAYQLARSLPAQRLMLAGLTAGAVLGVLMIRWGVGDRHMSFPTYGSARLFGAHQFIGCLASLGLLILPGCENRWRPLTVLAAFIVWTGLAWSGSRGPAVGLAVMLGLWFWRGNRAERRALLLWAPLLTIGALAFSYPLGRPYVQMGWAPQLANTLQSTGVAAMTSGRTEFWLATWSRVAEAPWFGHGADGYLFIRPAQWGSQPHNVALQWLYEYGWLGALPLLLLIAQGVRGMFSASAPADASGPARRWAAAALSGTFAFGLLEGVFYHAVAFMPTAVIAGCTLALATGPAPLPVSVWPARLGRLGLLAALVMLAFHGWLGWHLRVAPEFTPDSIAARALRVFPSTTDGLRHRIEGWRRTHPAAVMPWIRWAQTEAPEQAAYHLYAAQLLLWEKNFAAAQTELEQAFATVCVNERPDVDAVLQQVRASAQRARAEP